VSYRDHPSGYSKDLRRHHDSALAVIGRELQPPQVDAGGAPRWRGAGAAEVVRAWHRLRFAVAFWRLGDRERAASCLSKLGSEHLLLASVPATMRLLVPFLAGRALRRVNRLAASWFM
jgi:hypothetical protein